MFWRLVDVRRNIVECLCISLSNRLVGCVWVTKPLKRMYMYDDIS